MEQAVFSSTAVLKRVGKKRKKEAMVPVEPVCFRGASGCVVVCTRMETDQMALLGISSKKRC